MIIHCDRIVLVTAIAFGPLILFFGLLMLFGVGCKIYDLFKRN